MQTQLALGERHQDGAPGGLADGSLDLDPARFERPAGFPEDPEPCGSLNRGGLAAHNERGHQQEEAEPKQDPVPTPKHRRRSGTPGASHSGHVG